MPDTPSHGRGVRILLADDHLLFAESLMALLSEDDRVEVVGIAQNGAEAVELAVQLERAGPGPGIRSLELDESDALACVAASSGYEQLSICVVRGRASSACDRGDRHP